MFFEKFHIQETELQRLLGQSSLLDIATLPCDDLTPDERRIVLDDSLIGMLNTNEPPATKFVVSRIKAITNVATQLPPAATQDDQRLCLAALHLLTSGTPTVAKAILSDASCFVQLLCSPLANLSLADVESFQRAGNASGVSSHALDTIAFDEEVFQVTSGASPRTGNVRLSMHMCLILANALRATATLPASAVSDSLRYVQLSTSGTKSVAQDFVITQLQEYGVEIGVAAARALGVVKQAVVLATEMFSMHSATSNAFTSECQRCVTSLWRSDLRANKLEAILKVSQMFEMLTALVPLYSTGSREGEQFYGYVAALTEQPTMFDIAISHAFGCSQDSPSSLRVNVVRFFTACLTSPKWHNRWRLNLLTALCQHIAIVTESDHFCRMLAGESRREDQLRAVELMTIGCYGFRLFGHVHDGATEATFECLRALLPSAASWSALRSLPLRSPNCTVLHCAVEKTFVALAACVGCSDKSIPVNPSLAVELHAAAAGVLLDEAKPQVLAVSAGTCDPSLLSHAMMIAQSCWPVVNEYGFSHDPEIAQFLQLVEGKFAVVAVDALPRDGLSGARDPLTWFCQLRTNTESASTSPGASGSFSPSTPRGLVVVDEVDLETLKRQGAEAALGVASASSVSPPVAAPPRTSDFKLKLNDSSSSGSTQQTTSFESMDGSPRQEDAGRVTKKFSIKRRGGALTASPSSGVYSPPQVAVDDPHGNPLSLTSSLNESVHTSFDHRSRPSSFEVREDDEGAGPRFISGPRVGATVSPPKFLRPSDDTRPAGPDQGVDLFAAPLPAAQSRQPAPPSSAVDLFAGFQ